MQGMPLHGKKAILIGNITSQGVMGISLSAQMGFCAVESKYIFGGFISGKKKLLSQLSITATV